MKRKLKKLIVGIIVVGTWLFASGCAFVDATAPTTSGQSPQVPVEISVQAQDTIDGRVELRNWSQLIKEGREHLLFDHLGDAEQSFVAAFAISQSFRTRDVRRVASRGNLRRLAQKYKDAGNESSAARVLEIVAAETTDLREAEAPGLADMMLELGDLQQGSRSLEKAATSYERALTLRKERSGTSSATLIVPYQKLSGVEIKLEKYNAALEHALASLDLAKYHTGPKTPEMINAVLQTAMAYQYAGQRINAETQFLQALEAQREIETDSPREALALNGLAFLYLEMDRYQEGIEHVDAALGILDHIGQNGIGRAMVLDTKAQLLAAGGNPRSADALFDEVMLQASNGSDEDQRTLFESYENFLRGQNRTREASEIRQKINLIDGVTGTDAADAPGAPEAMPTDLTDDIDSALPDELDTALPDDTATPAGSTTGPMATWDE